MLVFLTFYAGVALYGQFVKHKEIPHFFAWFVFTHTPQRTQHEFAIRVLEHKGKQFDPPTFLNDAGVTFSSPNFSTPEYSRRVAILGSYIMQERKNQIEQARREVESLFLPGKVKYEVIMIVFNPIERFKYGRVISTKQLAVFDAEVAN